MTFLFSVFFGAGVAAVAYAKLGRRLGYGNTGNVTILCAVIFLLATIFFYVTFSTFIDT